MEEKAAVKTVGSFVMMPFSKLSTQGIMLLNTFHPRKSKKASNTDIDSILRASKSSDA